MQPVEFMPVAEDSGLICDIGSWVFSEVCRQFRQWLNTEVRGIPITVNVSSIGLQKMDLLETLQMTLSDHGLSPDCLRLELKESALMDPTDPERELLERIVELGINITLDDFGTGYASFSRLYHLPIGSIKIDSSVIGNLRRDSDSLHIVAAFIAMAKRLGLTVIAEGVETKQQLVVLRELDCGWGQGFVFCEPLSPEELAHYYVDAYQEKPLR